MAESKRTPERVKAICDLLRQGTTRRAAAQANGIVESTFYAWMEESSEFSEAVLKAESDCENEMASRVQVASIDSWQAAAWWLERRRNQDYARREKQDVDGSLRVEIIDKTNADDSSSA